MVAGLSGALVDLGEEVTVATPLYREVQEHISCIKKPYGPEIIIPLGKTKFSGRWWKVEAESGVTMLFLENEDFYDRDGLYMQGNDGYWDNPERFMFLSKAVAMLSPEYDVVHVHDWQTAFVPMLLKTGMKRSRPQTILTIHNLAYQGQCGGDRFPISNLPAKLFHREGPEFWGNMNFLKAGINFADGITTVSPKYAREILTQEFGEGLDGVLRKREDSLSGILNGVDYKEWNTDNNPALPASYSANDLSGKEKCKKALQKELGLPVLDAPLFGSITRLAEQKGIDVMIQTLDEILCEADMQVVVLGSGEDYLIHRLNKLQEKYNNCVMFIEGYNSRLAHLIEAGADFFLMPSRFEPCGLNQLYSLRYGTLPIVHGIGGLDDTIENLENDKGNGFKFYELSKDNLGLAIKRAFDFYSNKYSMQLARQNAMGSQNSWDEPAQSYRQLYNSFN